MQTFRSWQSCSISFDLALHACCVTVFSDTFVLSVCVSVSDRSEESDALRD